LRVETYPGLPIWLLPVNKLPNSKSHCRPRNIIGDIGQLKNTPRSSKQRDVHPIGGIVQYQLFDNVQ